MSHAGLIPAAELVKAGLLREVPIDGTPYLALELVDPKRTPTLSERVAIALRIQANHGKTPIYVAKTERAAPPAAREGEVAGDTDVNQREGEAKMFITEGSTSSAGAAGSSGLDADEITRAHAKNVKEVKKREEEKKKADAAKAKADAAKKAKEAAARKKAKAAPVAPTRKPAAAAKPSAHVAGISGRKDPSEFAGYPLDAKITVLKKEHDFADGSIRAEVFKKLCRCATVGEAKKVSTDPWHLRTAVKTKRLKVG